MRRIHVNYSNTISIVNNLRNIVYNLEDEKRKVRSALSELKDLENYYSAKNKIVQELEDSERKIIKDIDEVEALIDNISKFIEDVREVDGTLAHKFKQDIKEYAEKNNIEITSGLDKFLNKVQGALDVVGFIPGIGDIADGINAVISLARGDFGVAFISLVAMIPVIGDAAKGFKYMDKASDLLKLGDKVVDIGKATAKNATKKLGQVAKKETMGIIAKGEKAFKNALEATLDIGKGYTVAWIKNKGEVVLNKVNDMLPENIQVCLNNGCLVGDTLVKTKDGLKEIRDIQVGDLVLSKNEELGITEYKKVTELHKNSAYESCIIRTKNSIIEATTGHLFMIKDKWWTAAIDIASGDFIETANGIYEEIIDIEVVDSLYPTNVYNLTVEDNHNYFVSEEEILTHNMGLKIDCEASKTSYVKSIDKLKNTEFFKDSALEHILEGEINKRGKAVGFHYEGFPTTKGSVIEGTKSTPDDLGIYTGKVKVSGVLKTSNGGQSTFFPESWTAQDVVDAINEAFTNKEFVQGTRNTYIGELKNGMQVEMYIDSATNKIISAFPIQ